MTRGSRPNVSLDLGCLTLDSGSSTNLLPLLAFPSNQPSPSPTVLYVLFSRAIQLNIYKSPLWSSLTGSCHLSHRLLYSLSKPCPSGLAGFMGRTLGTRVPSDVHVPDLIYLHHKPQYLHLCLLLAHGYGEPVYEYKKIQRDR